LIIDECGLTIFKQTLFQEDLLDHIMINISCIFTGLEVIKLVLKDVRSHLSQDHFEMDGLLVELVAN